MCYWLTHDPVGAPLTSTGGKCQCGQKMSGNNRKGMEVTPEGEGQRVSQWVFGWNREPSPGQQGSMSTLPVLTTPMSTVEAQEVKYVYICAWVNLSSPSFSLCFCVYLMLCEQVCLSVSAGQCRETEEQRREERELASKEPKC